MPIQRLLTQEEEFRILDQYDELVDAGKEEEAMKLIENLPLYIGFIALDLEWHGKEYIHELRKHHNCAQYDAYIAKYGDGPITAHMKYCDEFCARNLNKI